MSNKFVEEKYEDVLYVFNLSASMRFSSKTVGD